MKINARYKSRSEMAVVRRERILGERSNKKNNNLIFELLPVII